MVCDIMQIANSVIFITGASSGIGLSLTQQFLEKGASVCAFSRRGMSKELKDAYPDALLDIKGDISNIEDIQSSMQATSQTFGGLHIVVANAGIAHFDDLAVTDPEIAKAMVLTNVLGMFYTLHGAYPLLQKNTGPRTVVGIHSIAATTIFEGASVYSATKAGTLAMLRAFREEARKDGISVLDVLPGATRTGIWTTEMLTERGKDMMHPDSIARIIINALEQSRNNEDAITHVDELVIRPWIGNL
ncbi:MAG: SDR family oxidoreductase [Ignavibacteria bacterium]|nr:SDR family oxidoreductase [Ignavibacteria bacterium]